MAWMKENPPQTHTFTAASDLSTKQYHFVKLSGTSVDTATLASENAVGVLQNAPSANQGAEVMLGGITKFVANSALSPGALIGPGSDGKASELASGYIGQVLEGVSASGQIGTAYINAIPNRYE